MIERSCVPTGRPYSTFVIVSGYETDGWGLVASGLRDTSPDELIGDQVSVAPERVDPRYPSRGANGCSGTVAREISDP